MAKYGEVEIVPGDVVVIEIGRTQKVGRVTVAECNSFESDKGPQWSIEMRDRYDQPVNWKQEFDGGNVVVYGAPETFRGVSGQALLSAERGRSNVASQDANAAERAYDALFDDGGTELPHWTKELERELDRAHRKAAVAADVAARKFNAVAEAVGFVSYRRL